MLACALSACLDEAFSTQDEGDAFDAGTETQDAGHAQDASEDAEANVDSGDTDADDGIDGATGDDDGGANADAGDEGDAATDAAGDDDACIPVTWYKDEDGDGWGNEAITTESCVRPGLEWVAQKGDCKDDDPDVHPDQTKYFGTGYRIDVGGVEHISYDFDCNGVEEGDPSLPTTPVEDCWKDGIKCFGQGYLPGRNRGEGTNQFCGSVKVHKCKIIQLNTCGEPDGTEEAKPYGCR